jgi:hypothetical protein
MAEKGTKLIFALYKSAKLNWGLQQAALKKSVQEEYYLSFYMGHQCGKKP